MERRTNRVDFYAFLELPTLKIRFGFSTRVDELDLQPQLKVHNYM
jgi:hypothetical protein